MMELLEDRRDAGQHVRAPVPLQHKTAYQVRHGRPRVREDLLLSGNKSDVVQQRSKRAMVLKSLSSRTRVSFAGPVCEVLWRCRRSSMAVYGRRGVHG